MVDDLPREAAPPAPAATPPAPAANTADKDVALFTDDTAAEKKPELEAPSRSPFAADVLPLGPESANSVRALAEANGEDSETAQALADAAVRNLVHFGVPGTHVANVIDACNSLAAGAPDSATVEAWRRDSMEALGSDFGGPEGAAAALETAKAWVRAQPQLRAWLNSTGLGSHPKLVRAIAATAHQARKDGRKF
jgi:hypothetical protein